MRNNMNFKNILISLCFFLHVHLTFGLILGAQNQINSISIQSDGKIVAAGMTTINDIQQFLVVRYTSSGSLDSSFGVNGCQTTILGDNAVAYGVALDASGNIVVVGSSLLAGVSSIALTRYTSSGLLDTTFGTNGIVLTGINSGCSGYALLVQSDGKIVVTGSVLKNNDVWIPLVRYNTNGSLDTSFGTNGVTVIEIEDCAIGYSLVQQPDGKFVIGGFAEGNGFVVRCNNNGTIDTTFNGTGGGSIQVGLSSFIRGIGLQSTGKIVVSGYSNGQCMIARLNSDGTLDTTFGDAGITTNTFSSYNISLDLSVDSTDRILIAGLSASIPIVARYTASGLLDTSFGTQGLSYINCGTFGNTNAILSQSDGSIFIAGFIDNNALIAKVTDSGALDTNFGLTGFVLDPTDYFPSCEATSSTAGYAFAYDTTTQTVSIANTFQDLTLNTNGQLVGWTHSTKTPTFTCVQSGLYQVTYTIVSEKTSGSGTVSASVRATLNSTEIPGSQLSYDFVTNSQTITVTKPFMASFVTGDILKFQYTGGSTACRIIANDGTGTTKASITVSIIKIA